MYVILPAGYLGSAYFGMLFVLSSPNEVASFIMTALLAIALLTIAICYADNWTLRGLCFLYLALLALAVVVQVLTKFEMMQVFLLFTGVMNGFFAIYDIWDDLIRRSEHDSDATLFAEYTHTSSTCWGVIWFFISLLFMALGVWAALEMAEDQ